VSGRRPFVPLRPVDAAGGDWASKDVRYAREGGPPKWLSAVALLAYAGIVAGVVVIVVGLL
jgi:hypothetical protein